MEPRRLYVVRGIAPRGLITYNCPTADWALRKLRDLKAADRRNVTVTDPDGNSLLEADLIGIVEGSGAAPSEEAMPEAPQIARQPALA